MSKENITTDYYELEQLIKLLINNTDNKCSCARSEPLGSSVNLVSSLWIVLFTLIIVQKVFKYVIKPCYNQRRNNENEQQNNVNRDPSNECIMM